MLGNGVLVGSGAREWCVDGQWCREWCDDNITIKQSLVKLRRLEDDTCSHLR